MKEKFNKLPVSLKRQILYRIAAGGIFLLIFTFILIFAHDFILSMPCLIISVYFIANGGIMLFNCVAGRYVTIKGTFTEVEKTALRKRVKAFYVLSDKGTWKILTQRKIKGIAIGGDVIVYMPSKMRVFEHNGVLVASGYYAYEANPAKPCKEFQ